MAKRRAKMVEPVASDQRFTPEHVLEVVRRFAPIGLDPCTTLENPTKAAHFYALPHADGLAHAWGGYGLIWLNPPYSRGQLPKWMAKAAGAYHVLGEEVVGLIPSDLGSGSGQQVATTADALCFVRGRLTFHSPAGKPSAGAKQPSVMPYWGERTKRFERVFSQLGTVWVR